MKIKPLNKSPKLYDNDADDSGGDDEGMASWASTDPRKIQAAAAAAALGGNRPPEIFFTAGEERTIRLLSDEPIFSFGRYRVRLGGRWCSFTQPARGQKDAFAAKQLRPQQVYGWEIIDYNGYKNKKGERVRNLNRYWLANTRIYNQLTAFRKRCGPLNKFDITVARVGEGTETTYNLMPSPLSEIPEKARMALKESRKKLILAEAWRKLYAPLSFSQQCSTLGISPDEVEDGSED